LRLNRDKWVGVPVDAYLKQLRNEYRELDRIPKKERDRSAFLCDMFYRGKHRVFLSPVDGWYKERRSNKSTIYHPENYFRVLLEGNVVEIAASAPTFTVRSIDDDVDATTAARAGAALAEYVQRTFFTETFKQDYAKRVQLQGTVGIYVWWNSDKGPRRTVTVQETIEEKVVPDAYQCAACGHGGLVDEVLPANQILPGAEGTMCPHCGELNPDVIESMPARRLQTTATEQVRLGDVDMELVPVYELSCNPGARSIRSNGRTSFQNLHYLSRVRLIDRAVGERRHGKDAKFKLASGTGDDRDTKGLHYQQRLERTYGGTETDRAGMDYHNERRVEYREDWLVDCYDDYVASYDHEMPGGKIIRAGQSLVELFPCGMKLTGSGEEIFEIEAENPAEHWRFLKFIEDPESFWGMNVVDAVPLQILLNESNSLITTNQMSNETPKSLVNTLVIKNPEAAAHPLQHMTYETLPEGLASIDLIYKQFPPQMLAAPAYGRPDAIRRMMQAVFGASFSGLSGEPGTENMKTATAWSVAQEHAMKRTRGHLALLGEGLAGVIEIGIDLYREYGGMERVLEIQGDYGEVETFLLQPMQLNRDLQVIVKAGSTVPRAEYQRRDDWSQYWVWEAQYLAAHGQPPPPALAISAASIYGVSIAANEAVIAARIARRVLRAFEDVERDAPQLLQQIVNQKLEQIQLQSLMVEGGDAMLQMAVVELQQAAATPEGQASLLLEYIQSAPGYAMAKIRPFADYHTYMIAFYESWLNTDDGLNASPLRAAMVEARIVQHYNKAAEKQMMVEAAITRPVIDSGALAALAGGGAANESKKVGRETGPTADLGQEKANIKRALPRGDRSKVQ
jgi:hypothetical protein